MLCIIYPTGKARTFTGAVWLSSVSVTAGPAQTCGNGVGWG